MNGEKVTTEIYDDFVIRCNNEDWDTCCNCRCWDNCELKHDRFPGLIPVIKKAMKKIFKRNERRG